MKLTTQRLKKLIREELKKINEDFGDIVPELEEIKNHAESLGMKSGVSRVENILPLYSNMDADTYEGEPDLYVQYLDDGSYRCQKYSYMGGKTTPCPTKEDVFTWLEKQ